MTSKPVVVQILEERPDGVLVQLPFLDTPVEMNHYFWKKRLEVGYFKPHGSVTVENNTEQSG